MTLQRIRGERWQHARLASNLRPSRALVRADGQYHIVPYRQRDRWECRSLVKVVCRALPPTVTTQTMNAPTSSAATVTTPTSSSAAQPASSQIPVSIRATMPIKPTSSTSVDKGIFNSVRSGRKPVPTSTAANQNTQTAYDPGAQFVNPTTQAKRVRTRPAAQPSSSPPKGSVRAPLGEPIVSTRQSPNSVVTAAANLSPVTSAGTEHSTMSNSEDEGGSSWICDPRSIALLTLLLAVSVALVCVIVYTKKKHNRTRAELCHARGKSLSSSDYASLDRSTTRPRSCASTPHTHLSTLPYDYNLAMPVDGLTGADGYDIPTTLKMKPGRDGVYTLPNNLQQNGRIPVDYVNYKTADGRQKPSVADSSTNDYMEPVD